MKVILIMLPFLLAFGPFDSPRGLVEEGNLSFETESFDEALSSYDRALKVTKDASAIEYNKANALIKKGEIEEALKSYQKAATTGDDSLKQRSYYNMGNALYNSEKFKEAAGAYKEALKANPQDKDAKTNLEMALQRIQRQKQDSKKNGDDKNEDSDKDKDPNKNKDNKKDGEQSEPEDGDSPEDSTDTQKNKQGDKEEDKQQQTQGDDEQKEQPGKDADKKEGEMSRTDAERLLDALGDRNIDLQTMKDMLKGERPAKTEKDW